MAKSIRVLVCGGRHFDDKRLVWECLDEVKLVAPHDALTIIQGGAPGADKLARDWCKDRFVPFDNYPAYWNTFGRAAGPMRNQRMIDEGKPDHVIAFPGGSGTADMVRRARAAGIKVTEIAAVRA